MSFYLSGELIEILRALFLICNNLQVSGVDAR